MAPKFRETFYLPPGDLIKDTGRDTDGSDVPSAGATDTQVSSPAGPVRPPAELGSGLLPRCRAGLLVTAQPIRRLPGSTQRTSLASTLV